MKVFHKLISLLVLITFVFPLLADARAGQRSGGGYSRGSSGFSGGGYQRTSPGGGYYRQQPSYSSPYMRRPYQQPSAYQAAPSQTGSIFSGLLSGIFGAWLYNKMFATNTSNPTVTNTKQTETGQTVPATQQAKQQESGGLLRIILLLAAAYLIWRMIRNRRNRKQNDSSYYTQNENQQPRKMDLKDFLNLSKGPGGASQQAVINLTANDQQAFENTLIQIQNAWSNSDLNSLRRFTTPDIYDNFSEILHENQQQGITSHVSQVKLLNQEVLDAWQEGQTAFARVSLTWSALDYAVNNRYSPQDPNYLIDGNMQEPSVVTEIWTFMRDGNSPWVLAEIQQA